MREIPISLEIKNKEEWLVRIVQELDKAQKLNDELKIQCHFINGLIKAYEEQFGESFVTNFKED